MPAMAAPIVIVGVSTALGGHLSGMERTPGDLRALGLAGAIRARPLLAEADVRDAGDLVVEPGFVPDADRRARNRARICEFLPRERDLVASVLGGPAATGAQFGAGMLGTAAGLGALAGWAAAVAREVDGLYVAFDVDCLDASGGWAVTMPEPDGLSLATALAAVRTLATAIPVVGFGATAVTIANGNGPATVDAIARLAEAALAPT